MPLNIGLTGGIGTGKSIVADVFERLGAEVFRADRVAKDIMRTNGALRGGLREAFGDDVFTSDGTLQAAWLAKLVFADYRKLARLNALVHPFVRDELTIAMRKCRKPVFVCEAAILYESELESTFDYIVVVDAEESNRIARTMARERSTAEDVRQRMGMQMPQEDKAGAADFVLTNNGTVAELEAAAEQLYSIISVLPPRDESERA